jgi:hypothetical protein
MVTEERIITLKKNSLEEYLSVSKASILPSLRSTGGKVLCVLRGLVGSTADTLTQLTVFKNLDAWQTSQGAWVNDNDQLIQKQTIRLLRTLGTRPNPNTMLPPEDRRLIYQYKSDLVSPSNFSEFILCNEEGVWPEVEKEGASALGMWTLSSTTLPVEIITLTGYESVSHWEKLHFRDMPIEEKDIWNRELQLMKRLESITETRRLDLMISAE